MNDNGKEWVESMGVAGARHKSLLLLNKNIFTYNYNKIHLKINSIIYCIRVYIHLKGDYSGDYKVIKEQR